jgi:uncharacterized protein (DUF1778 family)
MSHDMQSSKQLPSGEQHQRVKGERLEARVTAELKAMFQRAADLKGLTLTDYVINSLVDSSQQVIRDYEVLAFTGRNRDVFLKALMNPPAASPKLVAALARYREGIENGHRTNQTGTTGRRKARSKS